MNIDVCDARDPNPLLSCSFSGRSGEDTLYITVAESRSLLEVEPLLKNIDIAVRARARWIVFRLPPTVDSVVFQDAFIPDLDLIQRRLEQIPFAFVGIGSPRSRPSLMYRSDGFTIQEEDDYLDRLRHAEMQSLLRQPGVELPKFSHFHYEGPNGRHYPSFLRIGFALKNTRSVDAMVFWLSGRLQQNAPAIVDTAGLLPLAYALQGGRHVTGVRCLDGYDDPLPHLPTDANFIISVSSSGRMSDRAKSEWHRRTGRELTIVSLYGYPQYKASDSDQILCRLSESLQHFAPKDCPDCKKANPSPAARIDKSTYLLQLTGAVVPTRITDNQVVESGAFFERYPNSGAVSLHRDQDGRHHMVHLDLSALLNHDVFQERLAGVVRQIQESMPVDFVLSPTHTAAIRFATEVHRLLRLPPERLITADKRDELAMIREQGLDRRGCLLVDDVLITGHRLRTYKNLFRDLQIHFDPANFRFLVGIDRAPSRIDRQKVNDSLHRGYPYISVEKLMLPFWQEGQCPWCREYRLIRAKMSTFSEEPDLTFVKDRFHKLQNKQIGLRQGAFLPGVGGSPNRLGPTSLFGPTTLVDVEVFASVASALQMLRDAGELSERPLMPVAYVLESQRTTEGRFYDTVITASLLRGCRDYDLRTFSQEQRLIQEFRARLREAGGAELYSEIVLAVATDILPVVEDIDDAIRKIAVEQPGIAELLRKISTVN